MNETTGRGRLFLLFARVTAWATVPLYVVGMTAGIWLKRQLGLESTLFDFMLFIGFGAFALVGSLLVNRRPANPVSWIMAAIGLIVAVFPAAESYAAYAVTIRGEADALALFGVWANEIYWYLLLALALIYLPMLFPTGRLISRRWRWPAGIAGVATAGIMLLGALRPVLAGQEIPYEVVNPIGFAGLPSGEGESLVAGLLGVGLVFGVLAGVLSVVARFRRARGTERQQMKWFVFAVAMAPFALIPWPWPLAGDILFGLYLMALPAAVAVAILRYRLYDIDIIIRRTLIYTALSILLAAVYFGSVVLGQALFERLAGRQSALVIVISTLLIAAMFTPLRRRVQQFIDRRFYRSKYDAARTLAEFAQHARDEVELEALSAELVRVIEETMQPEFASLWLRKTSKS